MQMAEQATAQQAKVTATQAATQATAQAIACEPFNFNIISKGNLEKLKEYLKTHKFVSYYMTGGSPPGNSLDKQMTGLCVTTNDNTQDSSDVYTFLDKMHDYYLQSQNEEAIRGLARLMTISKIAYDTYYGKFLANLKGPIKTFIREATALGANDQIEVNGKPINNPELIGEDVDESVVRFVMALLSRKRGDPTSVVLTSYEDAPSSRLVCFTLKTDNSVEIEVIRQHIDELGEISPSESVVTFNEDEDDEDDEDDDEDLKEDIQNWLNLLKNIVNQLNNVKAGGAPLNKIRIPARVREHFAIPSRLTGSTAVAHIAKTCKKGDMAAYLGLSRNTALTKEALLNRIIGASTSKNKNKK